MNYILTTSFLCHSSIASRDKMHERYYQKNDYYLGKARADNFQKIVTLSVLNRCGKKRRGYITNLKNKKHMQLYIVINLYI